MATTKPAVSFTVLLGPTDGSAPVYPTDAVSYLLPVRITRSAGGQRLDHAEFKWDLADTTAPIQTIENIQTPTGFSRQVEILEEIGGGSQKAIFWGDLTAQRIGSGVDSPDAVTVTASLYPYHFGNILYGPRYWSPQEAGEVTVHEDAVFNPNIDGVLKENRSTKLDVNGNHELWADPESFRTTEAETYQGETAEFWTLPEAINALCWRCNPDEEFIKNPEVFDELGEPDPIFTDALSPENEKLPRGQYLPYYLDSLLPKYGFGWYVGLSREEAPEEDPEAEPVFVTVRRIVIFKHGEGEEKTVRFMPFGSTLELDPEALTEEEEPAPYQNLDSFDVTTDVGKCVNTVYVDGGFKQHEVTIELYRGWPEADDALTGSDLDKSEKTSQFYTADKTKPWRLWVANEAGDYCSTRTTVQPIPASPRDWSTLGVKVARRRKIEDPLTYAEDKKRRFVFVEWTKGEHEDPEDEESPFVWYPVPEEWPYRVFETQMAIEFTGDQPPAELIAAGDFAGVRVTGTLVGDERINAVASRRAQSPNLRTSELHVDVSSRFGYRQVMTTGDYASVINDGSGDADERDDSTTLTTYAEYARQNAESAEMDGEFVTFGIETDYEIGDLLTKVEGREVSLDRNAAAALSPKYPQVMQIVYDEENQRTALATDPREVDPSFRKGARPRGAKV